MQRKNKTKNKLTFGSFNVLQNYLSNSIYVCVYNQAKLIILVFRRAQKQEKRNICFTKLKAQKV